MAGGRTSSSFPSSNSSVFSWGDVIAQAENNVTTFFIILSAPFACSGPLLPLLGLAALSAQNSLSRPALRVHLFTKKL